MTEEDRKVQYGLGLHDMFMNDVLPNCIIY